MMRFSPFDHRFKASLEFLNLRQYASAPSVDAHGMRERAAPSAKVASQGRSTLSRLVLTIFPVCTSTQFLVPYLQKGYY